jgi:hypothetical protein
VRSQLAQSLLGRPATLGALPHDYARGILLDAWTNVVGTTPSLQAIQAVQAIALHETGYGGNWGGAGVGSHNWGAEQCHQVGNVPDCDPAQATCPGGSFPHIDHHADGSCYVSCFCSFPDDTTGARHFVQTLTSILKRNGQTLDVLESGDATAIANQMRANGYFEAPAASYASAIANGAKSIASALSEDVAVNGVGPAPPPGGQPVTVSGGGDNTALVLGGLALAAVAAYALSQRGGGRVLAAA